MKFKAILLSVFLSISVSNSKAQAADQSQLSQDQVVQLLEIVRECEHDDELPEIVSQEESAENFWETALQIGATAVVVAAALATGIKSPRGQMPPVISIDS